MFCPRPVISTSELYSLTVISTVTIANTAMYAIPASTSVISPYMSACMAIIGCENGIAKQTPWMTAPVPYHPVNIITNMGIIARMLRGMVIV